MSAALVVAFAPNVGAVVAQTTGTTNVYEAYAEEAAEGAVVQIGEVTYSTLAEAVAAVPTDGTETTIKLLANTVGSGVKVAAGKNIVFDLNGFTYSVNYKTVGSTGTETNGFQLLKDSTVTFKNGTVNVADGNAKLAILIQNYSNLTLDNANIDSSNTAWSGTTYAVSNNFGSLTVKGDGNITAKKDGVAFDVWYGMNDEGLYDDGISIVFDEDYTGTVTGNIEYGAAVRARNTTGWQDKASLDIKGGTFTGQFLAGSAGALDAANITVSGGTFANDVKSYLAEDSQLVQSEDGTWVVGEIPGYYCAQVDGKKYASFSDAVEAAESGATVMLLADASGHFEVSKDITIDLNGKTLTIDADEGFKAIKGGSIAISNGTLTSPNTDYISAKGGTVTLGEGLTVGGESSVIYAYDRGSVVIDGANISSTVTRYIPVYVTGEGSSIVMASGSITSSIVTVSVDKKATFTINGGSLGSTDSNAFVSKNGATVIINDGTVGSSCSYPAGYTSGAGNIVVNGGLVTSEGWQSLAAPNGTITVNGGTLTKAVGAYENSASRVHVKGGTVGDSTSWGVYAGNGAKAEVTGGDVHGYVGANSSGAVTVSGGTFDRAVAEVYCADGFIPVANADGTYGVKEGVFTVRVGSQGYENLEAAFEAAGDGGTITVVADDLDIDNAWLRGVDKAVTIDLGGKAVTGNLRIGNGAKVTLANGTLNGTAYVYEGGAGSAFTLAENATIKSEVNGIVGMDRYSKDTDTGAAAAIAVNGTVNAGKTGVLVQKNATVEVNGTVSGQTGIELQDGRVIIGKDATVTGAAEVFVKTNTKADYYDNYTTGAGIAVVKGAANSTASLVVNGGTITGAKAIYQSPAKSTFGNGNVSIAINDGAFSTDVVAGQDVQVEVAYPSGKSLREGADKMWRFNDTLSLFEAADVTTTYNGQAQPAEPQVTAKSGSATVVLGTDYEVQYLTPGEEGAEGTWGTEAPTGAGTYTAKLVGLGAYASTETNNFTYTIEKLEVAKPQATENLVYNNTVEEQVGVAGGDWYTVAGGSAQDAGSYTATVTLKDKDSCTWADGTTDDLEIAWSIAKAELDVNFTIAPIEDQIYTGEAIEPELELVNAQEDDPDYDVTYSDNINPGTATATVSIVADNYTGSTTQTFNIVVDEQVQAAQKAVEELPAADAITPDDEAAIQAARDAYDAVDDALKNQVDADKIAAAEEALAAAKAKQEAAPVQALIDALPAAADVTQADEAAIAAARAAYDALTDAQKAQVDASKLTAAENALAAAQAQAAADQNAAAAVQSQIDALPAASAVATTDEAAIVAARAAYDALTDAQKALVDTTKLTAAESALQAAKDAAAAAAAQQPAATEQTTTIDENQTALSAAKTDKVKAAKSAAAGATQEELEAYLAALNSDEPAGTEFGKLRAKSIKVTKKSAKVQWTKVKGAKKYVVYGNLCGKKNKYKKVKELKSSKKALVVKKVAGKKVAKNKNYKFIVVAFDKNNKVITTSKAIHVITKGKKTNYKKVTVRTTKKAKKVTKLTLKVKKTAKLKAKKLTKAISKQKVTKHRNKGKLMYESSNPKVVKVAAKTGKLTAKKKGTAYVYAYTQNGAFAKVKVTVK